MPYNESEPRLNTEISREHFYKYRSGRKGHENKRNYALSLWVDGNDKDMIRKAMVGGFNGGLVGSSAAVLANLRHRGRFTVMSIAEKSFRHGTPFALMGVTYGVMVGLLTNIRKEESVFHHVAAGFSAGAILGSWYKWPMLGVTSGLVVGVVGGGLKAMADNDGMDAKPLRRIRLFNMYRRGWFVERPDAEGKDDADKDVSFRSYRP